MDKIDNSNDLFLNEENKNTAQINFKMIFDNISITIKCIKHRACIILYLHVQVY